MHYGSACEGSQAFLQGEREGWMVHCLRPMPAVVLSCSLSAISLVYPYTTRTKPTKPNQTKQNMKANT